MKKTRYVTPILMLCAALYLSAQQYTRVKYNLETPFTGEFTAERFKGDSIVVEEFDGAGNSEGKSTLVYKHSEDGLRDTIYTHSGLMRTQVYIHSKEGRLLSIVNLVPNRTVIDQLAFRAEGVQINYDYGADGRIRSISTLQNPGEVLVDRKTFDHANNQIVLRNEKSGKETINKILYTDSGYLEIVPSHYPLMDYDTMVYVFDKENRLIRLTSPSLDMTTGRINVTQHYIYTDSGYISITDSVKEVHVFSKDGSKEEVLEYSYAKGDWQLRHREERLIYVGSHHDSGTVPMALNNTKVYSGEKEIVIETLQVAKVEIWSFSGRLIARQRIAAGISRIPLSRGLYIISVNGQGYKVIIQ